jgi:pimeloyl-ACP methyl ester carboxylesterase
LVYVTVETGAMIACKLAAMVPDRVLSLALLNVTGGGFECLPKVLYIFMSLLSCAVFMFLRTLQH